MYVMIYRGHGVMLVEMTSAEFKRAKASDPEEGFPWHERWTGSEAHRYVKAGGLHSTPLYIDQDGRIRYARDGY